MRGVRILGLIVGGVVALVVVLLLGVWLFVNPNSYKGRIAQEVKTATGRELALPGDIKLSVFPWIALELGPASLGNPPGFGAEPFVAVDHVALRVKLMPLLRGQLEVGKLEIDGIDLRLKKNAQGKGNWEDFGEKSVPEPARSPDQGVEGFRELAGVLIKDSRISYESSVVSNLNLDIGRVAMKSPVPVKLSFNLDRGADAAGLSFTGALTATLDPEAKRYRIEALSLSGEMRSKGDSRPVEWRFDTPSMDADLGAQTLKIASFTAQYAMARLTGSLAGEKIIDAPTLNGAVKLDPLVVREFLPRLGIEVPKTRDPKVLEKLAASAQFAYGANAAKLSGLSIQLDDSKITGNAAITDLGSMALAFDLALDQIDLDRYLSPDESPPRPDEKPVELPSEKLKALDANGRFSIGRARLAGIDLTHVQLTVRAKDGVIRLDPLKAQLYGGQTDGDLTYDASGKVPGVRMTQQMTGVDVAQVLKATIKSDRLSGRANLGMRLSGQGRTSEALIKDLGGHVDMNVADGAVEGIDLWNDISRAQALFEKRPIPPASTTRRTRFDTLKASADIAGGVASMKDINVASQNLRVTGTGTANLASRAIDYRILVRLLKTPPGQGEDIGKLALADIPVNITGTMADPKVRPDLEGIARAALQKKIDEKKDELKQKLGNKLLDLLSR